MINRWVLLLLCVAAAGALAVGLGYGHLMHWADRPMAADGREALFTVVPGDGLRRTAHGLEREGLISDALRFLLLARIEKKEKQLKAGEYLLSTAMSPRRILFQMVEGRVHLYRLTIPEGYTLTQIAAVVEAAGLASAADFLRVARDPATAAGLGIAADTLEGYLFPDTYLFPRGVDSAAIIATMVQQFRTAFQPQWETRAGELGLSVHQVVTLASIIEKETGAAGERPLVASVFHNRLKKGMRLETDPTVIYGIADFDGNLRRHHLETPTPYNTYRIKGLPPGPIASPGALALEAALYPATSDYLFFVSRNDGTHHFSTSLEAHNAAVRQYQLRKNAP